MNQSFLYSCDVTSFSSETQNISNQGKKRGLFISGYALSAQPYLKQPCLSPVYRCCSVFNTNENNTSMAP